MNQPRLEVTPELQGAVCSCHAVTGGLPSTLAGIARFRVTLFHA